MYRKRGPSPAGRGRKKLVKTFNPSLEGNDDMREAQIKLILIQYYANKMILRRHKTNANKTIHPTNKTRTRPKQKQTKEQTTTKNFKHHTQPQ